MLLCIVVCLLEATEIATVHRSTGQLQRRRSRAAVTSPPDDQIGASNRSRHRGRGKPIDGDEELTVQIQDYEKNQLYDAIDQTLWYETAKSGEGDGKMGYTDNLAANEHHRIHIKSKGGGQTTGTTTEIKPSERRKARDVDSKVIIRRYFVRVGRQVNANKDDRRVGRVRKTRVTKARRDKERRKRAKKLRQSSTSLRLKQTQVKLKGKRGQVKNTADDAIIQRRYVDDDKRTDKVRVKNDEVKSEAVITRDVNKDKIVRTVIGQDKSDVIFNDIRKQRSDQNVIMDDDKSFNYKMLLRKNTIDDFFKEEDDYNRLQRDLQDKRRSMAELQTITNSKMRRGGLEVDVDTFGIEEYERDVHETPNWIKDTKAGVNPMTIQGGVMRELKMIDNSNMAFQKFSDNPAVSVPWKEPQMMSNCWIQLMLSNRYSFAPSCNEDGSFLAKQCYLERCWCVDIAGLPSAKSTASRFYFKQDGVRLTCPPQAVSVAQQPPPTSRKLGNVAVEVDKTWPSTQGNKAMKPAVLTLAAAQRAGIPMHDIVFYTRNK